MPVALTRRAKWLMPVCLLLLVALSVWRLRKEDSSAEALSLSGRSMGTTYAVIVASAAAHSSPGLAQAVQQELNRVEQLMSTYREDSEVSRFNSSHSTEPMPISQDTAEVVQISLAIGELSQGALDITVRPLVAAWGFGAGAQSEAPTAAALQEARERVGYKQLKLAAEPEQPALLKLAPAVEIDLSAVAKGYAVDRVALVLEKRGLANYMVEVGGEVRVGGTKKGGQPWRIGIEQPDSTGRTVQQAVALRDISLATSGDYRNYYERDGQRLSHTIDPRSGRPITHALASVSVLHESAAWADGWATALNVLGPDKGLQTAKAQNLAALFIVRESDGQFRTHATPEFSRLTTEVGLATPNK